MVKPQCLWRQPAACGVIGVALVLAACNDSSSDPPPAPATHALGGTVSGLATGATLVLQDAAAGTVSISANGSFAFTTTLASGVAYNVSVKTAPASPPQDCSVAQGSGIMGQADVGAISVTCVAAVPLALSISAPSQAPMGTLARYTVTETHGIALTSVTWTFDGIAGGHALAGLANGTVQVWNTPGAHAVRVVATASGGRSGEATAATTAIGAPLVSSSASSCALTPSGDVQCWGYGNFGTLGNGGLADQATPVAATGLSGMLGLAGGGQHICGVTGSQAVMCWGDNTDGQLGHAASLHISSNPLPVAADGLTGVVSLAAGATHTCALKSDGSVVCFGDNTNGQLGTGSAGTPSVTPLAVTGLGNVVALSAGGGAFTCALKADGSVLCWGDNSTGQLGDGLRSATPRATPGPVLTPTGAALTGVLALRSGAYHTCAILDDGHASVVCWGYNAQNQVSGGAFNVVYPATPVPGLSGVNALSMTSYSSCASGFDGSFACWGNNAFAESDGKGVAGSSLTAPAPFGGLQGAQQPLYGSGGNGFLCVLGAAGGAQCVGRGNNAQLGNGVAATAFTLQTVNVPAGTFWH